MRLRKRILKPLITIIIIGLLIWLGFYIASLFTKSSKKGGFPTVVILQKIKPTPYQPKIQAIGSLSSFEGIMVKAETAGRVTHIYFKSGQMIKKGQPIIQIFPDTIQAQFNKAIANLKLSKLTYSRQEKLYQKRFISKQALDQARDKLEAARADVQNLRAQLDQTEIRAHFDGKLGLRLVSLGDYVTIGQNIVQLQSLDPIRADFSVPERYLHKIDYQHSVDISSEALSQTYQGKIFATNSKVDLDTRMLDMRATLSNQKHQLLPGMFVNITLYTGKPEKVMLIPQSAVTYDTNGDYIYKDVQGKAVKTIIKLGDKIANNQQIVKSGLKVGDIVITQGQEKLYPGATVVTALQMAAYMKSKGKGK